MKVLFHLISFCLSLDLYVVIMWISYLFVTVAAKHFSAPVQLLFSAYYYFFFEEYFCTYSGLLKLQWLSGSVNTTYGRNP